MSVNASLRNSERPVKPSAEDRPMRFAYADPPDLGCAGYYKAHHPDAMIWNDPETHRRLIERLCDEFPDGWALSLSEASIWTIAPMCPKGSRLGAWISKYPRYRGNNNAVMAHFEPVVWFGGRPKSGQARCADFIVSSIEKGAGNSLRSSGDITLNRTSLKDAGFVGSKPRAFCLWIFDLLGARPGDDFHDLFPGSGAVSAAWAERCGAQPDLPLTPLEALAAC